MWECTCRPEVAVAVSIHLSHKLLFSSAQKLGNSQQFDNSWPRTPPSFSEQIKRSFIADEYLAEEIHLNCNDERSLVAGSTSANKLAR